jgi:hypothetical protein
MLMELKLKKKRSLNHSVFAKKTVTKNTKTHGFFFLEGRIVSFRGGLGVFERNPTEKREMTAVLPFR